MTILSIKLSVGALALSLTFSTGLIVGILSISTGETAVDDTTETYEQGLELCFDSGQQNVESVAEMQMDRTVGETAARVSGFLVAPRMALEAAVRYLSDHAEKVRDPKWIDKELRQALSSIYLAASREGVTELGYALVQPTLTDAPTEAPTSFPTASPEKEPTVSPTGGDWTESPTTEGNASNGTSPSAPPPYVPPPDPCAGRRHRALKSAARRAAGQQAGLRRIFRGECGGEAEREGTTGLRCGERCAREDNDKMAVRCCSSTSIPGFMNYPCSDVWGASQNFMTCWRCTADVTFAEAKAVCEAEGARLCTPDELQRNCVSGSGCGFDWSMMWTEDTACAPDQAAAPAELKDWCLDDPSGDFQRMSMTCPSAIGVLTCYPPPDMKGFVGTSIAAICPNMCGQCPGGSGDAAPIPMKHQATSYLLFGELGGVTGGLPFDTSYHSGHKYAMAEMDATGIRMGSLGRNGKILEDECNINNLVWGMSVTDTSGPCPMGSDALAALNSKFVDGALTDAAAPTNVVQWSNLAYTGSFNVVLPAFASFTAEGAPVHPQYGEKLGVVWAGPTVSRMSVFLRQLALLPGGRMYAVLFNQYTGLYDEMLGSSHGFPMGWGTVPGAPIHWISMLPPQEMRDRTIAANVKWVDAEHGGFANIATGVMHRWTGPRRVHGDNAGPCLNDWYNLSYWALDRQHYTGPVLSRANEDPLGVCEGMMRQYGCYYDVGAGEDNNGDGNQAPQPKDGMPGMRVVDVCPDTCGTCTPDIEDTTFWVKVQEVEIVGGLKLRFLLLVPRDKAMAQIEEATRRTRASINRETKKVEDDKDAAFLLMIIIVVVVVVFLLLLSVIFTKVITDPLQSLAELMVSCARMNFSAIDDYKPSSFHEIQVMNDAFMVMVTNLKEFKNYMPQHILESSDDEEEEQSKAASEGQSKSKRPKRGSNKDMSGAASGSKRSKMTASQRSMSHASRMVTEQHKAKQALSKTATGLTKKKCSWTVANIVQWHATMDKRSEKDQEQVHMDLLQAMVTLTVKSKGLCDTFAGDRLACVFNAQKPLNTHKVAACQCGGGWRKAAAEKKDLAGLSVASASGDARVGNIGCQGMKRFTCLSATVSWVYALERHGSEMSAGAVVDRTVSEDAKNTMNMRIIGNAYLAKSMKKPTEVWQVFDLKEVSEDEWMYQLEEGEAKNQFSDWDKAVRASFGDEWDAVREHLAKCAPQGGAEGGPFTSADKVMRLLQEKANQSTHDIADLPVKDGLAHPVPPALPKGCVVLRFH